MRRKEKVAVILCSRDSFEIVEPFERPGQERSDTVVFIAVDRKRGKVLGTHRVALRWSSIVQDANDGSHGCRIDFVKGYCGAATACHLRAFRELGAKQVGEHRGGHAQDLR